MAVVASPPISSALHQATNYEAHGPSNGLKMRQPLPGPSRLSMSGPGSSRSASSLENVAPRNPALQNGFHRNHTQPLANSSIAEGAASDEVQTPYSLQRQVNGSVSTGTKNGMPQRPKGQLTRAKTDYKPDGDPGSFIQEITEPDWGLRHGWEDPSKEEQEILNRTFYMHYTDKRHETGGKPREEDRIKPPPDWSHRERTKTVSAALVLCLNLGVDPPDVIKPSPSAAMECWVDPTVMTISNPKILETIGKKLQDQYENLSIKTRYKQYLDPSVEETRKFTTSLRKNAKDERVLFHYNGHGVPLPTPSGEIWVFNRDYTQYIPVSLYDLQSWLGGPSIYIYDCSHAGNIITNFDRMIEKHETENAELKLANANAQLQVYSNNIQLAACGKSETLPTNPLLPADLFTSCLNTPIEICIRFHYLENQLPSNLSLKDLNRIPGRPSERRSPKGELNWILTSITDTIAWNVLPRDQFRKLFRQDLMIAALFRNFLVAQRIMRAYGCHPMSSPEIPQTHNHPLWEAWDLAVELVFSQVPALLAAEAGDMVYEYEPSPFFTEQLTAFEKYLEQGAPKQEMPYQLPIVLQVLLSQAHRLRALILLSRFLDSGPWAVDLSLTIGIFPYVVKLLQSPATELKPILIFIWTRIIAVAPEQAQTDLLKENGYQYFTSALNPDYQIVVSNAGDHRAMSAFLVAMFCRNFPQAQNVCLSPELINHCIDHLNDADNPLLRQWSCLCISMLWANFPEAKWVGIRRLAHHRLCALAIDPVPEVRTAAIHALTNFLGIPDLTEQVAQNEETIASALMVMSTDGSVIVRKELLVFYSLFVKRYQNRFLVTAYETLADELDQLAQPKSGTKRSKPNGVKGVHSDESEDDLPSKTSANTVQGSMWLQLIVMTVDAHPEVALAAIMIVDYVHEALLNSPLAHSAQQTISNILDLSRQSAVGSRQPSAAPSKHSPQSSTSTGSQNIQKYEGYLSIGMRRTASVAAALKHFVGASPSSDTLATDNSNSTSLPSKQKRQIGPLRPGVPAEWVTPPDRHDTASGPVKYQKAKVPLPSGFGELDNKGSRALPVRSEFVEWSIEYFREPQMKSSDSDEPGSNEWNSKQWRKARNGRILDTTQPLKAFAGKNPWDIDAGFFNNGSQPTKMTFHQYEDHLAIADDHDSICIWNWRQKYRINRFSNDNPIRSKINEVQFINEDDQAFLMTGSSDGVVKIFRHYESEKDVELVSAYRALTDLIPSTKNAGLVFDWQQGQGKLLVAGDVKVIRVWNAATEICTNDIPARSGSCITSLTSDSVAGDVFCAGYGDGAIRVFDQRLKPAMAMTRCWREHKQWITNVHLQRGGDRELVSGSRNGEIKLWDIRMEKPIQEIVATKDTLRTLSVHEHAPVFATGSDHHALTFFNTNGAFLNSVTPYSTFLSTSKATPIASTAFHPHRMMLATSSVGNGYVNVYVCVNGE